MKICSVILDIPTQALDAPYTYRVPQDDSTDDHPLRVGCAVTVPFGHRQAVGFVIDVQDVDESTLEQGLDASKLKYVKRVVSEPYFDEEGAACAQFLAKRYVAPLSACVRLFTPPGGVPRMVRTKKGYWHLEQPKVGAVDDRWVALGPKAQEFVPRTNAVRQKEVIAALQAGELRVAELALECANVSAVLKTLEAQGVVVIKHRRRLRGVPQGGFIDADGNVLSRAAADFYSTVDPSDSIHPSQALSDTKRFALSDDSSFDTLVRPAKSLERISYAHAFVPSEKPVLTKEQKAAVEAIEAACQKASGDVVLVDGVTGSGKTEVYLRAIETVLVSGRTACVLVPEIALTPQTVARFRGRFGDLVAVMHSRMSLGERYDQWDFIRSGAARVVVGARSALFTPLANVGLYVIDEEHEGSYKQDSAPRYHARDVAIWMARRTGATVVLGSATPSIESLYAAAKDDHWHQVVLSQRANGKPLPAITVIDMAKEFSAGSRSMFSHALTQALEEELALGHKAVLLLNQRGFAKFVLCRDCGFVPSCVSCSTSLTFHEQGNRLVCHHCGYQITAPPRCPKCGSPYLRKFGAGTQRVEADLRTLVGGFKGNTYPVSIIRMDADTTARKGAHARLLEMFAEAPSAILLGTQMIAKGLDFADVTLVGVINADTMLNLPDYRAAERTFNLLEQVAGRAGRADLAGRVMVQTYQADAVAIAAAARYDRPRFLQDELPKRKALGYPPYTRMANVLAWGKNESAVRHAAEALREIIAKQVHDFGVGGTWQVLSAVPCVLAKLRGTYRYHIVIKAPPTEDPAEILLPLMRNHRKLKGVNIAIDIDPQDLL